MAKKKTKRLRQFFVQLVNHTDRRDNEAIRVRAYSAEEARCVASLEYMYDSTRFSLGYAVPVTGKNKWERQMSKELRAICSN